VRRVNVVQLNVETVIVRPRFRRELHDLDALARSLETHGQLQPIAVTPERVLIFGQRRLEAAKRLGWATIEAHVIDPADCTDRAAGLDPRQQLEVAENDDREGFTASERVAIAAAIEEALEERRGRPSEKRQKVAEIPSGERTDDAVAALAGLGNRTTYRQARAVVERGAPKIREDMDAGEISISAAAHLAGLPPEDQAAIVHAIATGDAKDYRTAEASVRRERRVQAIAATAARNAEITPGLGCFALVYADPPWRYEHVKTESRAIENQYPTMELEQICALDVASITTDDAVLLLWTTAPKLEEAFAVIRAWGFTYRTNLVWDKDRIGMGYWARIQHEHLLVATKGEPPTPAEGARPASVVREKRDQKHSRKPASFYGLIESTFPGLPKVELFCRTPQPGWSVWGNEAEAAE
jgi:N6-adenosine-specific RNA methylase IME4/ParB-like chromosome segregation protein Spo0J